ncbi:MAG: hypothetical protein A2521_13150 [Deltaproteobacteria bacterium RIFOXYD12_FULL_57_12]|nr:MAG: hypothetical protein A2521_13150 [Deltaproteobacteria bacterium RIFOXYD12_FULL_57_12]
MKKTYAAFKSHGFHDNNTIAATCICRDEISQSLRSVIKHMWGEAFNLSSLAGMFTAGKTGLKAAMHHAPVVDGKERYIFYAIPHIAIEADGRLGICCREGREEESTACGALNAFQKEMASGKLDLTLHGDDMEQSLLKTRLLRDIPYGHVPDLLELTKITQAAIQADIEHILEAVIQKDKCDYGLAAGIQVHGPKANYVWPAACYVVVNGEKIELNI